MPLILKSKTLEGKSSWSAYFNKSIATLEHGDIRTENIYLNPELYQYTDLMKATELGSIAVIETQGCDIIVYGIPGAPAFMTRSNYGKINTVYNVTKNQCIPPEKTTNVYVGSFGKGLLDSLIRYNPFFESIRFLLTDKHASKYIPVTFELVVE